MKERKSNVHDYLKHAMKKWSERPCLVKAGYMKQMLVTIMPS
jgi:hypothetical protein